MTALDPLAAARAAVGQGPDRPATAIIHDVPQARLVVFRLAAGQQVPPHRSDSAVLLTVLAGEGMVSGGDEERSCAAGDLAVFAPQELHGMRALDGDFLLLATITPRPGGGQ